MRISSVEIIKEIDGLLPSSLTPLNRYVVLTGENGSGKTRILKLVEKIVKAKNDKRGDVHGIDSFKFSFSDDAGKPTEDISQLTIINYSHSDLPLQSVEGFPPYVINKSKDNLKEKRDFAQTAREALLYLTRLTKYAEQEELDKFNNDYCMPILGCNLEKTDKEHRDPLLFGHQITKLSERPLSPGQKYLLRLCVALDSNVIPAGAILFLDEPESHLHPKVLLELFEKLEKFKLGQIWIATHSIELISHFWYSDIWYMAKEKENKTAIKKMGSKTEGILNGVLGDDQKRYRLHQFVSSPDIFAYHAFAAECLYHPNPQSTPRKGDPSTGLAKEPLRQKEVILDFGAGKGRFLESFNPDSIPEIDYFAYDKHGYIKDKRTGECSADYCKSVMEKYFCSADNYLGDEKSLEEKIDQIEADKILMINVLHEIAPVQWQDTFQTIQRLLKDGGELLILECEELTYGERPFESDFFVMQHESLIKLFACKSTDIESKESPDNKKVVRHIIPKHLLRNVNRATVVEAITETKILAEKKIRELKENTENIGGSSWKQGIALAFWTHQFTNASLFNYPIESSGDQKLI